MAIETYLGEEITKRKTKCRLCGQNLLKGEKRVAVEYDPYTYTTSKHKFTNYYHPGCWNEKNTFKKKSNNNKNSNKKKNQGMLYIVMIVGIILFLISKILFFITLFIFLAIGIAYALHKTS
ncbi:MAG: hypothetical protein AABX05_02265 [Nanoarchaeota archaeon]|mgnify:CR=1 FL=1